jgi:hypothetical protein
MSLSPRKPKLEPDAAPVAPGLQPPEPLPELQTLDQIHAALGQLDLERAETQGVIDGGDAAEAALIDDDAADAEFAKLTMTMRAARRRLVRLDRRERQLLLAAQRIEDARRQELWSAMRLEYQRAAQELHDAAEKTAQLRERVLALSVEGERAGFGAFGSPALPALRGIIRWDWLTGPLMLAKQLSESAPPGRRMALGRIGMVEFIRPFGSFKIGTIYQMPVERTKWLVEQGYAKSVETNPWGAPPVFANNDTTRPRGPNGETNWDWEQSA